MAMTAAAPRLVPLILVSMLAACGGGGSSTSAPAGGGSSSGSSGTGGDSLASLTMSCADGSGWQCSGSTVLRVDNGIKLTRSGVQVAGKSTNDLEPVIALPGRAIGLTTTEFGTAEVRVRKDAAGAVSTPALLLSNFDISWDGVTDRPIIIETFMTSRGRVELNDAGALSFRTLPPPTDTAWWDAGRLGRNGTKINYANNSYFPRTEPSRCPADLIPCPTIESNGVRTSQGDWRTGGVEPDTTIGGRLHEDGDAAAGIGQPDANGNPTYLGGSTAPDVPFPGSKGWRSFDNWSYRYANFAHWTTQDTVNILEWGGLYEHNRGRRGAIAYGDVTAAGAVPTTGTASYTGVAYGWYSPNAVDDPVVFRAAATITANFATRQVSIALSNAVTYDASLTPLPANVTVTTSIGGGAEANYMTAAANNGVLNGGLSARFFGPVVSTGTSGAGPAEIAGVMRMTNAGSGQIALGGFIGAKR